MTVIKNGYSKTCELDVQKNAAKMQKIRQIQNKNNP